MRNGQPHARVRFIACAIVLLAGLPAVASAEEPVYFADANLKAAVEGALGKTDPTPTDMLALTGLNAGERGISNLTGLEHAVETQFAGWAPGSKWVHGPKDRENGTCAVVKKAAVSLPRKGSVHVASFIGRTVR